MSLILSDAKPSNLQIKTWGTGPEEIVYLGEYKIPIKDFLCAACYVLTNTDLRKNDPRLQFKKCVRSMRVKREVFKTHDGRTIKTTRLVAKVSPVPSID